MLGPSPLWTLAWELEAVLTFTYEDLRSHVDGALLSIAAAAPAIRTGTIASFCAMTVPGHRPPILIRRLSMHSLM
jgi:hypothetical protein